MHSSSLKRAVCGLALLLSTSAAMAQPITNNPPPPPYPGVPIRLVTWNVHPTNIGPQTADDRIRDIVNFARNNNIDIIALQEVPRALLDDAQRLNALSQVVMAQGYNAVMARTEYPNNGRAPTAARQNAYLIIFNPARLTLAPVNPNASPFYQENHFIQGAAQARPPVLVRFNVHHNNRPDTPLNLLSWHNEAGTMARTHMNAIEQLVNQDLEPRRTRNLNREDWVLVGDFNVQDTTQEMVDLDQRYNVLSHEEGIDHIVTGAPLDNVVNDDPAANIDPLFRSTHRHLALFGLIHCGRF